MRKILLLLTIAGSLCLPQKASATPPSIDPNSGRPLHACKTNDPFSVARSCYWDARKHGNRRGHSYDVYHHHQGAVVTEVCVHYWRLTYAATHDWCQHATEVIYVGQVI